MAGRDSFPRRRRRCIIRISAAAEGSQRSDADALDRFGSRNRCCSDRCFSRFARRHAPDARCMTALRIVRVYGTVSAQCPYAGSFLYPLVSATFPCWMPDRIQLWHSRAGADFA